MWVLGEGLGRDERTDCSKPASLDEGLPVPENPARTARDRESQGQPRGQLDRGWCPGGGKCLVGSADRPEPSPIFLQGSWLSFSMAGHKLSVT